MKQKWIRSDTPPSRKVSMVIFFLSISVMLTSCFLKQDRTTTVYGTVTDQNGLPVDSIMVSVRGKVNFGLEDFRDIYSNEQGNYQIVVDVPKKFHALSAIVPFLPVENAKYQNSYQGFTVRKNDVSTSNCCTASIGEKTKYDFQLIPK